MEDAKEALEKISEIHNQLAKASFYKGYRSIYVALSGIIGLLAVIIQPLFVIKIDSYAFVIFWCVIAVINISICAGMIGFQYVFKEKEYEKQRTKKVIVQFFPLLVAGGIFTFILMYLNINYIPLLPGIWAIIFGMGIFNLKPYLPDATIIAAIYYFMAGSILLVMVKYNITFILIGVGICFGIGQLLSAVILYIYVEKHENGK